MATYIILAATYAFAAAIQPGPFQAYIISESLRKGWRHTIPAAFSPLVSDGPIIALIILLLSRVPPSFVRFLHFAGGAFILYLAGAALRAWRDFDYEEALQGEAGKRTMLKAVLVNLVNPNPYLGWSLVMGPLLIRAYREAPSHGISMLVSFYFVLIAVNIGIILLFSLTRKAGPKVTRATLGVSVLTLALFGAYQIWLGFSSL